MHIKKIIALMLALVLTAMSFTLFASSLEPYGNGVSFRSNWFVNDLAYTFSDAYRTSVWYDHFSSLVLTDNQRNNVLRVAISQLGYHEGSVPEAIDGYGTGDGNYVEYGHLVTNFPHGSDWCATFVNWCLSQARITHAGGEIGCQRWIDDVFIPQGNYQPSPAYGGTYLPHPADIIFFDWDTNGYWADHIGIVLYTDETTVYTIEGNTKSHDVGLRSYPLDDARVLGYGTPAYEEGAEDTLDFSGKTLSIDGTYLTRQAVSLSLKDGASMPLPVGSAVTVRGQASDGLAEVSYVISDAEAVTGYLSLKDLILLTPVEFPVGDTDTEGSTESDSGTPESSESPTDTEAESKTEVEDETPSETQSETVSESETEASPEKETEGTVSITDIPIQTQAMVTADGWRFAAKTTVINGISVDLPGYRDHDAKMVLPAVADAAAWGIAADHLTLSGWAMVNGGQWSYVWSLDGVAWQAFTGGTLSRATQEIRDQATDLGTLTRPEDKRAVFTDLTAVLPHGDGRTVTVYVGVVSESDPTAVCHFLIIEHLSVGETAETESETETETDTETETEPETEVATETETEPETEVATETETETGSSIESDTESNRETESDTPVETETDEPTEKESTTLTDTETTPATETAPYPSAPPQSQSGIQAVGCGSSIQSSVGALAVIFPALFLAFSKKKREFI